MKKWIPWIVVALCALILAGVVFGLLQFLRLFSRTENKADSQVTMTVEAYFETTWQDFALTAYDSQAQSVTLRKDLDVTYEQACLFGKECYEDMALGHTDTMKTMQYGCAAACGIELKKITVCGRSSDGQEIYTVSDDGTLTACWEDQP